MISIFVGAGDMDTGKAVFNSMQRAGHDARPGWLAFVKACFGWGWALSSNRAGLQ